MLGGEDRCLYGLLPTTVKHFPHASLLFFRYTGHPGHPSSPRPLHHLPSSTSPQSSRSTDPWPRSSLPHQPPGETQDTGVCPTTTAHPGQDESRSLEDRFYLPDPELVAGQQLWQPAWFGGQQCQCSATQPDGHGYGRPEFGPHCSAVWKAAARHSVRTAILIVKNSRQIFVLCVQTCSRTLELSNAYWCLSRTKCTHWGLQNPPSCHVCRLLLGGLLLVCPFSVQIRHETLTASLSPIELSSLHDTEGPRDLSRAL